MAAVRPCGSYHLVVFDSWLSYVEFKNFSPLLFFLFFFIKLLYILRIICIKWPFFKSLCILRSAYPSDVFLIKIIFFSGLPPFLLFLSTFSLMSTPISLSVLYVVNCANTNNGETMEKFARYRPLFVRRSTGKKYCIRLVSLKPRKSDSALRPRRICTEDLVLFTETARVSPKK